MAPAELPSASYDFRVARDETTLRHRVTEAIRQAGCPDIR
jgi:hypothetical protein